MTAMLTSFGKSAYQTGRVDRQGCCLIPAVSFHHLGIPCRLLDFEICKDVPDHRELLRYMWDYFSARHTPIAPLAASGLKGAAGQATLHSFFTSASISSNAAQASTVLPSNSASLPANRFPSLC